jgi:hypothetical protein
MLIKVLQKKEKKRKEKHSMQTQKKKVRHTMTRPIRWETIPLLRHTTTNPDENDAAMLKSVTIGLAYSEWRYSVQNCVCACVCV